MNLIMTGKTKSNQVVGFEIGWDSVDVMNAELLSSSAETAFSTIAKDDGLSATIAESGIMVADSAFETARFTPGKGRCDGSAAMRAETRVPSCLSPRVGLLSLAFAAFFTSSKALGCQVFTRAADAFRHFVMCPFAALLQAGLASRFPRAGGGLSTVNASSTNLVLFIQTFFLQKFRCWRFEHNVTSSGIITYFAGVGNF